MSIPMNAGAESARENARQANGEFGTQPVGEADVATLVDPAPKLPALGSCPDCLAPMGPVIGKDGEIETFLPGTECPECGHTSAQIELESDPVYDEDGRIYLYALESDGTIRITDDDGDTVSLYRPEDDSDWDANIETFGVDAAAVRSALADPYDTLRERSVAAGEPVMGEVFDILLNRERVPRDFLVNDCASDDDIEAWATTYIEPAMRQLAARYAPVDGPVSPYSKGANRVARQSSMDELFNECDDAGDESMKVVYTALVDRESLSDFAAANTTAGEVEGDYEEYIAPAIDKLEQRLLSEYRTDAAHRRSAAFFAEVEAFTEDGEIDPADLRRVSVELFEGSWQQLSDDDYSEASLREHADVVAAIGNDLKRPKLAVLASQLRAAADTAR